MDLKNNTKSIEKLSAKEFNEKFNINVNTNDFVKVTKEEFESKETRQLTGRNQSVWKDVVKRFFKNKWNLIFTIIVMILLIFIIFVPMLSKYSPLNPVNEAATDEISYLRPFWVHNWNHVTRNFTLLEYNVILREGGIFDENSIIKEVWDRTDDSNITVSLTFVYRYAENTWLGTDSVGRDVFVRLFSGAAWSLGLAVIVATIQMIIGTSIGIYVGYHVGTKIDTLFMRIIEIFQSVPTLLWLLIFSMVIGTSFWSIAFVLILVGWVGPVYMARMYTLRIKDAEFIQAASSIGVSQFGILRKHVLPAIIGRMMVSFVQKIPAVIFLETTIIFLGMSIGGESTPTIGNLVSQGRNLSAIAENPYFIVSVSVFLLIFTVSLQIIANGIRDAFDPKSEVSA